MRRSNSDLARGSAAVHGLLRRRLARTIKVGAVVPLTGRYASIGNDLKHGYDIAVERINAAGGDSGRKPTVSLGARWCSMTSPTRPRPWPARDPCSPRSARLFWRGRL